MSIAHYQHWQLERLRDSCLSEYRRCVRCMGMGWDDFWQWANQAQRARALWIKACAELKRGAAR